jgi:hypothetical protein
MARVAGHNIDEAPVLVNGSLAIVLVALSNYGCCLCRHPTVHFSFFFPNFHQQLQLCSSYSIKCPEANFADKQTSSSVILVL